MRQAITLLWLAVTPAVTLAQSSQFGVRGLGLPGRGLTARAMASGGAFGTCGVQPVNATTMPTPSKIAIRCISDFLQKERKIDKKTTHGARTGIGGGRCGIKYTGPDEEQLAGPANKTAGNS